MKVQDDRRPEDMAKPHLIVMATDKALSGWGGAENGKSYAGWAVGPDDIDAVVDWLKSRPEMANVRTVSKDYRPDSRANGGHVHIYRSKMPEITTNETLRLYGITKRKANVGHTNNPRFYLMKGEQQCSSALSLPEINIYLEAYAGGMKREKEGARERSQRNR